MSSKESVSEIQLQPASVDIWDKKYRLRDKDGNVIDHTIEDTFKRVARELADVEETEEKREYWYKEFLWAMENGAYPAGRILSNAGALEHKPATSTINCTVSGTIHDSMDGILTAVHQAGLTLKSGAGIGYCFSTLRPKGAYVSGAGAYTSGPLSFMDIFDKMCFTVSSAGGRRGAQMGTFDVGHPDVIDFIRAKREDGRLRQFNLSLLITKDFMEAVKNDADWQLSFPITHDEMRRDVLDVYDQSKVIWRNIAALDNYVVNDAGQVACKVYSSIKARRLWDIIMSSTYDYAEPGFLLVDKVNEMNNNWFCEDITATNPCVTADTRIHTQHGLVQIGELYDSQEPVMATVENRTLPTKDREAFGVSVRKATNVFCTSPMSEVFEVTTKEGYSIKATEWHEFFVKGKGLNKVKLKDLKIGDKLPIQSGKGQFGVEGSEKLGELLGLIAGDGHFTSTDKGCKTVAVELWNENKELALEVCEYINTLIRDYCKLHPSSNGREYTVKPVSIQSRDLMSIKSVTLARILDEYGFNAETKLRVPEVVWKGTEDCVKGYLRALFQTDGTVNCNKGKVVNKTARKCSIRLNSVDKQLLLEVQILLANFGIKCSVLKRRDAGTKMMPDGKGGLKEYFCKVNYELIINSHSRDVFMSEIGFLGNLKTAKYNEWMTNNDDIINSQQFYAQVSSVKKVGLEPVFDVTQPDGNSAIFRGLATSQCAEQGLPPNGACLLGSINLVKFISRPFTEDASFDWTKYRQVVNVFSRMLDNVVEINGLPLESQRLEITRKRRHGMGYLGLGSAITMLGMTYGDEKSIEFTEEVTRILAVEGWYAALEIAKEKGPAPIMDEPFVVTSAMLASRPEMVEDGYKVGDTVFGRTLHAKYSRYMQTIATAAPELVEELAKVGARYTHATSIAPTGTLSLSVGNNVSNGIEPSFAHHYSRNVIREGKKSKEKIDVFSCELLAYRQLVNPKAMPYSDDPEAKLPSNFISTDEISPKQHVDIQAVAQKWIDSALSKTINTPTNIDYEDFKDIYEYAYDKGLKGCTTFRFNPEAFQGVLVKESDLESTVYEFTLENGETVELKGNEEVEYDGEIHTAANLYDALKEGYYGKF